MTSISKAQQQKAADELDQLPGDSVLATVIVPDWISLRDKARGLPRGPAMIALRVVRGVTNHFVGRWPEWVLSTLLFMLGVKLLVNSETFASSPGYATMANIADEDTWGSFLALVAGVRLIALCLNGTFESFARWSPIARSSLAILSGFAWFSIAMGLYLANPNGAGYITYSGLLLADIINGVLAAGDAGASERRYRNAGSRKCG